MSCRLMLLAACLISPILAAEEAPLWYKGPIVFHSNRGGDYEIYLRSPNGVITNISNNPATDKWPSFSPDGKRVVFTSDRTGQESIWIMNSDGSLLEQLISSPDGPVTYPHYSGDGSQIVYTGSVRKKRTNIYLFDRATRVTTGPVGIPDAKCQWGQLTPDNQTLAFTRYVKPGGELPKGWHVTLKDMATGASVVVGHGCEPSFSKDGSKLLYVHYREDRSGTDLYQYDLASGTEQKMTDLDEFPYSPRFCRSGNWIVYTSSSNKRPNRNELYLMPAIPFAEALRITNNDTEDAGPDIR